MRLQLTNTKTQGTKTGTNCTCFKYRLFREIAID
jgi:hypothetical protein